MATQTSQSLQKLIAASSSEKVYSDVLIAAGEPIQIKNASGWKESEFRGIAYDDVVDILKFLDPNWEKFVHSGKLTRVYKTDVWCFRISAFMANAGARPTLSIRRIPRYPITLRETKLPPQVSLMVQNPRGLILVSGATGAGKTTTMAAMAQEINETRRNHIVTIEDPIEYVFSNNKSVFSQREVGVDTPSFAQGAADALRQCPDVIMIGEIRDAEVARTAILAGESGHLVIATLHASSAYGAIQKMLNFFPGETDAILATLSNILVGMVHQVMLPHRDQERSALACELLFNHKQQFSKILGSQSQVNAQLDRGEDGISRTMVKSLATLVKDRVVTKEDALMSVFGQGLLYDRLKTALGS